MVVLNPSNGDALFPSPLPFTPYPLPALRAGRIKQPFGPFIPTAINKTPLPGPIHITPMGISTDEHAFSAHNSPDKALLHYSGSHYNLWKTELPASAERFKDGAFGENLCTHVEGVDASGICIGDVVTIGREVVLEVSEPRAPCYKLNLRFGVKDMAKRMQTLFRTGWLYRVLETGVVQEGDMVRLVERPNPEWSIARVMHYLYIEKENAERMNELVELKELGKSVKKIFKARLEKGIVEDMNRRMYGNEDCVKAVDQWSEYRIVEKRRETRKVAAVVLEQVEREKEAVPVEPGSHVRVKLGGKLVRAYSVVGGTSNKFEIGVALDPESRGGSKFLHEKAKVGDVLTIGRITAGFPLAKDADRHIIIAGGIGITAFLSALKYLQESRKHYELHFAVAEDIPFESYIMALGANAKIYNRSRGQRLDLNEIISNVDANTHIYCCGPQGLMDGVEVAATQYAIPDASVHFEQFVIATSGDPFTAELRDSKKTIEIGGSQSLLDALKGVGMDVDSSCEAGNCGTCRIEVCSGRIEHRGTGLLEAEKQTTMLGCVSRGIGHIVLDL